MNDVARASPLGDLAPAPRARRDGANAPLSHTQRLLWLYEQSVPGTPIYNVPLFYDVDGAIDVDALKCALNALGERHEILGCRFDERDAEPFYAGRAHLGVDFRVIDASGIDARRRSSEADRLMRAAAYEPFHLSRGPAARRPAIGARVAEFGGGRVNPAPPRAAPCARRSCPTTAHVVTRMSRTEGFEILR